MITFITSHAHRYTVDAACSASSPRCAIISYEDPVAAREWPPGSYVFCDLERLSDTELQTAAEIFRLARNAPNVRCFNDPAKAKTRFGLLRCLREAGINDFDPYANWRRLVSPYAASWSSNSAASFSPKRSASGKSSRCSAVSLIRHAASDMVRETL